VNTFLLPDLGEGLTEAEIVRWLVAEGDLVAVDQAVVEVETAKSVVELPSPYAGRVAALHGAEGAAVDVGKPLFSVEPESVSGNVLVGYGPPAGSAEPGTRRRRPRRNAAPPSPAAPAARTPPAPAAPAALTPPASAAPAPPTPPAPAAPRPPTPLGGGSPSAGPPPPPTPALGGSETRPRLRRFPAAVHRPGGRPARVTSPLVRKLARDGGVDVSAIAGTGPDGLVTRADVVRALEKAVDSPVGQRRIPLTPLRKAVSAALTRSRSEIPEATVWVDVDATELWRLRETTRTPEDPGPGILAYLAKFTVAALGRHPVFNSRIDGDDIVEYDDINLGIATNSPRGLVVPSVSRAQTLSLAALDGEIRRVTREGRGNGQGDGTFTLNNYGGFNVDGSAAIINHPQVAILGFGRMLERPWVVGGEITVRRITQMSFVFDHRVCDGGEAAAFMRDVADAIENPLPAIVRF
jgi:2-oxoisovalerate dehydrogenase E2 component (dihydrolipoyl transacylase)